MQSDKPEENTERNEFWDALRKGALVGIALLVIIIPPLRMAQKNKAAEHAAVATAPATQQPPAAAPAPDSVNGVQLADFKGEQPSADALKVANWAVFTGDAKKHAFVIVDKKDARVYVFGPDGKLKDSAPALLGAARGDDTFPGVGDKPIAQVLPEEKTTPAGRFVAEPGRNANGEDVVWVDYAAAVSMHRIRPLVAAERRLERLATLTVDDNRISFGCINLPVSFYEDVLNPTVKKYGAIVYVLPETRSAEQVFGAYDVLQAQAGNAHAQQVAFKR
ncbi:hypothetical protein LZ009_15130 [Ramlibacter sp. XY19]|uniref:hypothetical protein n=1 Tax=Ramlibacter paludis TaxID=2908000 RepID=UPI0023D9B6D6|nr:hypothetical protein [Ramlibacter paludis]MCG2594113.1 hypothetical protein [Ramlibacter paludis]